MNDLVKLLEAHARQLRARWPSQPRILDYTAAGAAVVGVIAAIVGLIVGLHVHATTAAFAAVEIGLPGAVVGAGLGLSVGAIITTARHLRRR